jgi:2Fe-2S ferredoxin
MGGENPYITPPPVRMPTKTYRVTFQPMNVTYQVDPAKLDDPHNGLPGSLLHIGDLAGVSIDHACGGVCACSTCHVLVKDGAASCNEATDDELDMLENAPGLRPNSRLSCQAVPDGSCDVVVEIPGWNRNLVREPDH